MTKKQKNILETVYDYQVRLQGVANSLGIKLATLIGNTDETVLRLLKKELIKKVTGNSASDIKKELSRLRNLVSVISKVRKSSFDLAKDLLFSTSADVIKAGTDETAKEFNQSLGEQARKEREKRFCKTLTDEQQHAILDYQTIDGKTIGEWFNNWQRSDIERISNAVQRASVEEMSIDNITKIIRGTRENNFTDGILATSKNSAVTLARTVVNGVSNNARVETIKENQDVIDGVKFVGTLDGKTCIYCASLDGKVWKGQEMGQARRPPIHPNCRCTLIPYIDLKFEDGTVADLDGDRPAANADFDQLAKDAYNKHAREMGWKRRWNDLSSSTRLKYYYQAQKDYERDTGNKAYEQKSGSYTFAEYFKNQSSEFKRSWLGAKRYALYEQGTLTEEQLFKPNISHQNEISELLDITLKESHKDYREYKSNIPSFSKLSNSSNTSTYLGQPLLDNPVGHALYDNIITRAIDGIMNLVYPSKNKHFKKPNQEQINKAKGIVDSINKITDNNKKKIFTDEENNELQILRKQLHDILLPEVIDKNNDITYKTLIALIPDKYENERYLPEELLAKQREGTLIGIEFFVRFLNNIDRDIRDLKGLVISSVIKFSAYYKDNVIYLDLDQKSNTIGKYSFASTVIHELGHALEHKGRNGLEGRFIAFLKRITYYKKSTKKIIETSDGAVLKLRKSKIEVPDKYALLEISNFFDIMGTEVLSTFVQCLYETPELIFDPRYSKYFDGIFECLR